MKQTPPTFSKANRPALKKLAIAFVIVLLATLVYIKAQPYTHDAKLKVQLESTSQQLKNTKIQLEQQQTVNEQQVLEKQKQLEQVQQKLVETEKALQAKRAAPKVYAAPAPVVAKTYGGTKEQWMTQAGIPQSQWWAVDYIVSRESGWRPNAVNPNGGACGLAQSLPCSKLGPNWSDPVVALKWQFAYVNARYGGYAQAVAFWQSHHWY